jgi:hypothetical protein
MTAVEWLEEQLNKNNEILFISDDLLEQAKEMEKQQGYSEEEAVLLTKRFWWQVYKRGWHKHTDLWGGLWWIRYKWNKEQEQFINK